MPHHAHQQFANFVCLMFSAGQVVYTGFITTFTFKTAACCNIKHWLVQQDTCCAKAVIYDANFSSHALVPIQWFDRVNMHHIFIYSIWIKSIRYVTIDKILYIRLHLCLHIIDKRWRRFCKGWLLNDRIDMCVWIPSFSSLCNALTKLDLYISVEKSSQSMWNDKLRLVCTAIREWV